MNIVRLSLLILAALFVALLPISRALAWRYAPLAALLVVGTIMFVPFAWLICAAFKDPAVMNDYTFFPPPAKLSSATVNLENFRTLFTDSQTAQGPVSFWEYARNSLFLAAGGTIISLVFSSMGGYALAKFRFRGRSAILSFMLASMAIPGVVLLAPNFEVIWKLGWMDTYRALLIPGAVSVFGVFLFRQAMLRIPDDLVEAGRIDGCGEFRIYLTIMMPLVRPMIGAYCLMSFLGGWNSFLTPNIFSRRSARLTLPVVLNQYITVFRQQYGVFLAGTLLAIIPPAIVFLLLQRDFIKGLTSGAVKQ